MFALIIFASVEIAAENRRQQLCGGARIAVNHGERASNTRL